MIKFGMGLLMLALAGCSGGPVQQPKLETGITASGGGGPEFLRSSPSAGITTRVQ